ncbi:ribonuclease J [bacterium]|nr:ribonuclease J [bacterium]
MTLSLSSITSETEAQTKLKAQSSDAAASLRLIPMGGVEEFGMNMMIYEMGNERLAVDCGAMFPDSDMLGVDLVIPDVSYLLEEPEKLRGIVLTHGHDDHIGALPYILPSLNVPVYGTRLTLAFLGAKLEEHGLLDQTTLIELKYNKPVQISSNFNVQAIHVTHSVPNAASIAIRTPAGTVLQTGDYKIDYSPIIGEQFDFHNIAKLSQENVLALVGDSTNSDIPGSTHTERWLGRHLEPIFASSKRAVFCTTFSTSVHRIQLLINLAEKFQRKVFVAGRSFERTIDIATDLGLLKIPRGMILSLKSIEDIPPQRRLILATGSQAEPFSAMSRIAVGEHRWLRVEKNDTIIHSARVIPGHMRPISRMINHFYKQGARVFESSTSKVHASGHAYIEEIKAMISMVQPRYLVPVHGEVRQLMHHRDIAIGMGFDPEDIFLLENGDVLEFHDNVAEVMDKVPTGHVLVDGKTIGETGEVVLRDRQHLSEDGMLIAILNVDKTTGALITPPEIVTRGFVYVDESEDLINELRDLIRSTFEALPKEAREDQDFMHAEVRRALRKHIRRTFDRFPVILPVIQQI